MMRQQIVWMIVLLFFISPTVSALGLTTLGGDVGLYRGETTVVSFLLQNMVGDEDIRAKVEIIKGEEIARLMDGKSIYTVPFGRKDIPINFEVTIPEDALPDYQVAFTVTEVPASDSQPVKLAVGLQKSFRVFVEDGIRPETETIQTEPLKEPVVERPIDIQDTLPAVAGTLVLVFIIWTLYMVVKRHKKKYDVY